MIKYEEKVKDPDPGSGSDKILIWIRIRGSEIRDICFHDPNPGSGSDFYRIIDPIRRIFGIRRIQSDPG